MDHRRRPILPHQQHCLQYVCTCMYVQYVAGSAFEYRIITNAVAGTISGIQTVSDGIVISRMPPKSSGFHLIYGFDHFFNINTPLTKSI